MQYKQFSLFWAICIGVNGDITNAVTNSLEKAEIICDSISEIAILKGSNVQLSQLLDISPIIQACGNNTIQIHVYASDTILLDANIELENLDMVLMAPTWQNPYQTQPKLTLTGNKVSHQFPSPGSNGQDGNESKGQDGTAGCSGKPGSPGGTMIGITDQIISSTNFLASTIGGIGGKGQTGGNGGIASNHRAARWPSNPDTPDNTQTSPNACGLGTMLILVTHYGFSGYDGGNGGNGGAAGKGGLPGTIDIIQFKQSNLFSLLHEPGQNGTIGTGGSGGNGGSTGNGYSCQDGCVGNWRCVSPAPPASNGRVPGSRGSNGNNGVSESCSESIKPAREIIQWAPIVKYIQVFYNETNNNTVNFINEIYANQKIKEFSKLKSAAEESWVLANVNRNDTNLSRLREMYVTLIGRLETFSGMHYDSLSNEHKKVTSMLIASVYSSIMNLDQSQAFDVIVDVSIYFGIVNSQIERLRTSAAKLAVEEAKQEFHGKLQAKVEQSLGYLDAIVFPAIDQAAQDIDDRLSDLGQQLEDLILDTKLSLEELKAKLRQANEMQGIVDIVNVFSFLNTIATYFVATPEYRTFDLLVKELQKQFAGNAVNLERLQALVEEAERLVTDLEEKQEYFRSEFEPLVESLMCYFRNISESLKSGEDISAPQLGLTKWQIVTKLKETNNALYEFSNSSLNVRPLIIAFDQIQDSLTMAIDLYEMIEDYIETQNLAGYIAKIYSSVLDPIQISDPELAHTVANFEVKLKENLLDVEVKKAMNAFKQWVFPFAKFYFLGQDIRSMRIGHNVSAELGDDHLRKMEELDEQLQKYKALSVGNQDTFIILNNFTSGLKTSKPFFTWENQHWRDSIESLISGNKVQFTADVRQQGFTGWEAIKFRLIEINFKLNEAPEGIQEEFDDIIEYFGVFMTHSGMSYYRFLDDYFVMTGANQTLRYNFERDANGNRQGTNQVYEKFKNGDYLLSPYTLWTIQMFDAVPTRKGRNLRNDVNFERLQKFLPYMDVELVGMGIYVDGEAALGAAGGDLMLEKYYEKDEKQGIIYEGPRQIWL